MAAVAAEWNGPQDPEECSVYYYDVYTVDGLVLQLRYSLTD